MRTYSYGQEALSGFQFAELSLGFDYELFAGVPGETRDECELRLDVAREVMKDLVDTDPEAARCAEELMRTAALPLAPRRVRRVVRQGVQAA